MLLFRETTFTRSDGTVWSRVYERLTRASRRQEHTMLDGWSNHDTERAYRQGVKDALEAIRTELSS